jgi:hypothetical protein
MEEGYIVQLLVLCTRKETAEGLYEELVERGNRVELDGGPDVTGILTYALTSLTGPMEAVLQLKANMEEKTVSDVANGMDVSVHGSKAGIIMDRVAQRKADIEKGQN